VKEAGVKGSGCSSVKSGRGDGEWRDGSYVGANGAARVKPAIHKAEWRRRLGCESKDSPLRGLAVYGGRVGTIGAAGSGFGGRKSGG